MVQLRQVAVIVPVQLVLGVGPKKVVEEAAAETAEDEVVVGKFEEDVAAASLRLRQAGATLVGAVLVGVPSRQR